MGSYFRDFHAPKATQQPTIGDTKFSVITQDHMGWMNCDGRLLSTETYPLLFRVVQYSFGGSNDLFRLPDMRSAVPGAIGPGSNVNLSVSERALGDAVGEEEHVLTIPEMPIHNHLGTTSSNGDHTHTQTTVNDDFNNNATGGSGGYPNFSQPSYPRYDSAGSVTWSNTINSNGSHNHTFTTSNTGGSLPHNNMQPTLFIGNMFIYSGKIHGPTSKWRYEIDTNIL
jgi:microcystin-dependent protein